MPGDCDSIPYYSCGDSIYWEIVKKKLDIMPFLIDKLDDTTTTAVKVRVEDIGGNYAVADVAFSAMQEIIYNLPTDEFMGRKPFWHANYWKVVRLGKKERKAFKKRAAEWYKENKANLIWIPCDQSSLCIAFGGNHPNGGYYELKE